MNTAKISTQQFVWDLTKAALTSLAVLGSAGCDMPAIPSSPAVARIDATPAEILRQGIEWEGRQVTIHATPRFVEDRSSVDITTGRFGGAYLSLDLRYVVTVDGEDGETFELPLIRAENINIGSANVPTDGSYTDRYKLPPNANVISGTVRRFQNGYEVYLAVESTGIDIGGNRTAK